MDIRLICMDLDGTALQDDHSTFSPRLLAALEEAYRRGTAIVPVTGRQYKLLPRFLQEHPVWESLAVLCNGGQVRRLDTGEVLFNRNIGAGELRGLLELAARFDLPLEFSVDSTLYLTAHSLQLQQADPSLVFHREFILGRQGRVVDSLEPLCGWAVEKGNLLCIPQELRAQLEQSLEDLGVSAVWASPSSMEITHRDATKGKGAQQICRLLNLSMEQVMALGDSGNDVSMLRQAGLGVAMGNAPDFVKAAADTVTESNTNDGAAMAIERYVLSP